VPGVPGALQNSDDDWEKKDALKVLAAAHAENGHWPQAVQLQEQAVERYRIRANSDPGFSRAFPAEQGPRIEQHRLHRPLRLDLPTGAAAK